MQCGEHRTAISSSSVVITYGQKSIFWKFDSHHGTRFLPFLDIMIQINSEKNDGTKWGNILICIRRKWLLLNEAHLRNKDSLKYAHSMTRKCDFWGKGVIRFWRVWVFYKYVWGKKLSFQNFYKPKNEIFSSFRQGFTLSYVTISRENWGCQPLVLDFGPKTFTSLMEGYFKK